MQTESGADDASPPSATQAHQFLRWCCLVTAWSAILVISSIAVLRVVYQDGTNVLTCINAFTLYLYLPAYVCLAWAAWQRRFALALLSLAIVICHVYWIFPQLVRDARFAPAEAASAAAEDVAPTVRIFFANVFAFNEDPTAFLHEIPAVDPDVIILVEYFPWWHPAVSASPILKTYPYGISPTEQRGSEFAIYSRIPIENAQKFWAARRMSYAFDLRLNGGPLRIFCLHAPRPMDLPMHDYQGFWAKTESLLESLPDPAVVVGDFNATPYSRVLESLTKEHFRSAHNIHGRGLASTWPNGRLPIPPIRIDHALLTPGVECVAIREGLGRGSDHKPLILDVRVARP